MKNLVAAKRYAKALFDLAIETKNLDVIFNDLQKICVLEKELPIFPKAMQELRISEEKRRATLVSIADILGLSHYVKNFLLFMFEKNRIDLAAISAKRCIGLIEASRHIATPLVQVASKEFAPQLKKQVEDVLEKILKTTVQCSVSANPDLIGGFILQIGNTNYDASIQGKLERMKEDLWKSASTK